MKMLDNPATLDASTSFDVREGFNYAFDFCEERLRKNRSEVIRSFRQGNKPTHSYFRYGLAKKIGAYLGSFSESLFEVYIHGSSVKDKSGPGSDIDIIILVDHKLEPFKLLLFKLNDEIEFFYNELMKRDFFAGGFSSFLDAKLVNRSEYESRMGFGAVINSANKAPIKIWDSRESESYEDLMAVV